MMCPRNGAPTCLLSESEKAEICRIVYLRVPPYQPNIYDAFAIACRLAANELPIRVHEWADQVKAFDFGVLHNLPIDDPLPATPTVRQGADGITMLSDRVIGTISALFGHIYTFEGKRTNRHIQNIYPLVDDEYTQLAGASKVALEWHVEDAFLHARPHWVCFLCLRGDADAETKVARARDLQLPLHILRTLKEPRFQLRVDETFTNRTPIYVTTSILTGKMNDPQIIFDPAYTVCQGEDAAHALTSVVHAANQVSQAFTLMGGDLLILNNRSVMHARSAFDARMDGSDRWLKRALILEDSEWSTKIKEGVIPFEINWRIEA